nr:type II toxin-antitoxin system VapC family toxin [Agrobacterium vitis]
METFSHTQQASKYTQSNGAETALTVLMEFQLGITELCARDPVKAVRLNAWYQTLLSAGFPIIETGKEVAEVWGILAADPRLKNLIIARPDAKKPRSGQDLHIAAASIVSRRPIATFNVRDFMLINSYYALPGVYNPLENKWYAKFNSFSQTEISPNGDRLSE